MRGRDRVHPLNDSLVSGRLVLKTFAVMSLDHCHIIIELGMQLDCFYYQLRLKNFR